MQPLDNVTIRPDFTFAIKRIMTDHVGLGRNGRSRRSKSAIASLWIAGSYVWLNGLGVTNDYPVGWLASVGWNLAGPWAIVGEVGGSYETTRISTPPSSDIHAHFYNFAVGPRIASTRRQTVRPFAQVLLGGVQAGSEFGSISHFAWQPGGGIDVRVSDALAIRVQTDYRVIPFGTTAVKQWRIATGVVLRK
jgi:hypothetical protein